jgi:hypothetical protein
VATLADSNADASEHDQVVSADICRSERDGTDPCAIGHQALLDQVGDLRTGLRQRRDDFAEAVAPDVRSRVLERHVRLDIGAVFVEDIFPSATAPGRTSPSCDAP